MHQIKLMKKHEYTAITWDKKQLYTAGDTPGE